MKIQIDTTLMVIRIEEKVNFGELINYLDKLFPDNLWKEFSLECQTISNWSYPIYVKPYVPYNPYDSPWRIANGTSYILTNGYQSTNGSSSTSVGSELIGNTNPLTSGKMNLNKGIYNVEIK